MAWFGVGSGSRRAKPGRVQGFEQADRVVVEAFSDLQQFEREAWNRLIDYLIKLPPLPSNRSQRAAARRWAM